MDELILVRATNIIPFDGIVRPLSNSPYIKKINWFPITQKIGDWLKEEGLIEKPDPSRYLEEDYFEMAVKKMNNQLLNYIPYLSDYNPYILFSLNGLVPDDSEVGFANNTFNNKLCAIIEPAKHHIDQIKSIEPTDTALLGDIKLSNEAIILINEGLYKSLTEEEKQRLHSNGCTIYVFNGLLKDAIKHVFDDKGYQFETLSLSRLNGGYIPSNTSNKLKITIDKVSKEYNIPRVLFFNIVSRKHDFKHLFPIDIMKETQKVYDYYIRRFISSILTYLGKEDLIKEFTTSNNIYYQSDILFEIIKEAGTEKYLDFIQKYNANLEALSRIGKLPTPEEIINQANLKKTI